MMTGAALFAAEACSGGSEHPPVATDVGHAPGIGGGGTSGNGGSTGADGGNTTSSGGTSGTTSSGGSSGSTSSGASDTTSSGGTSDVNPGDTRVPGPIAPSADGG